MRVSSSSQYQTFGNSLELEPPHWTHRLKAELQAIPTTAYWVAGLAVTAATSAYLAMSFQQSVELWRLEAQVTEERTMRERYEGELQNLRFQLSELRGRQGQAGNSQGAPRLTVEQQRLMKQIHQVEALIALAEQSNLAPPKLPPYPRKKPGGQTALPLKSSLLGYTSTPQQVNVAAITSAVFAAPQPQATGQAYADIGDRSEKSKGLLKAYTQAALNDIKRTNRLLEKAGVPVPSQLSTGGVYQELKSQSLSDELTLARRVIEHRMHLGYTTTNMPFARPLEGYPISSSFGPRTDPFLGKPAMHTGLDYRAPVGTPIKATGAGVVSMAKYNGGYGLSVEIIHENGLVTKYAHMRKILVSKGQRIERGDLVGTVGNTGRSTGPHLHYEVRINGEPINPMRMIRTGDRLKAIYMPAAPTSVAFNQP